MSVQDAIKSSMLTGAMSGGTESVEFLNEIMAALQPYLRVAVSKMVKDMVEPMFKETLPGPLKTLHFKKVDLGATPVKFSAVDVHKVEGDSLKFDMDVDWDGDMDVELDADYVPEFGVQHVKFKGRLTCLLRPLIDSIPLIGAIQIALINPPEMELDFTGAAQALDLAFIDDSIREIISDVLAGILVLPNRMLIKMDPLNNYYKSYLDPIGIVRFKVVSASGLKTTGRLIKDVPDAYCVLKFGGNRPWTTSTIDNTETPVWNEEHDFLLSDRDQKLSVQMFESDVGTDAKLGKASVTVGSLFNSGKQTELRLVPLGEKNSDTESSASVIIACEVFDLVPDKASIVAPSKANDDNLLNGVLTILVSGAKGLKGSSDALRTQVAVQCGDQKFSTPVVAPAPAVDVNNPCYDSSFRVMLTPEIVAAAPDVKFTLTDAGKAIGEYTVGFADLLNAPDLRVESEFLVESGGTLLTKSYLLGTSVKKE